MALPPQGSGRETATTNPRFTPKKDRGGGRGDPRRKKRDLGRAAWSKTKADKRQRNDEEQAAKRARIERGDEALPIYATEFSKDDIAAEERRPKKKVAVLIGYSGTGYKGMQLAFDQKTIEGDLFKAFVAAGAISKANATDPKKSSFVRCARTDKGVHAAGNIISLKLIVEDEDIVKKINDSLGPQIRVWGFERTNNGFSAYQMCDSRIYEYLIPTHSFLPPHPSSFLARKIEELAQQHDDDKAWRDRQEEVVDFWDKVEADVIEPILGRYDLDTRKRLEELLYYKDAGQPTAAVVDETTDVIKVDGKSRKDPTDEEPRMEASTASEEGVKASSKRSSTLSEGLKELRAAYMTAKRSYRISTARMERIQACLKQYEGTNNHHNFTVDKSFRDPSAKRVIKSFVLNQTPILIDGSEWLSLKVHGQSFMMHQIRKMVGMVALVVRCGCDPQRITEAFGEAPISIPKAPSLGLLLERPVFDNYNKRAQTELGRGALDFGKYEKELEEFKQKEIYERIYREEESQNMFNNFFNHIDSYANETFLFVTSGGIPAAKGKKGQEKKVPLDPALDSDEDDKVVRSGDGDEG